MNQTQRKRYCIAYGCLSNNVDTPDLSLFQLPKDHRRRKEWLQLIGRDDLLNNELLKHHSYEVCSNHFKESELRTIKLLRTYVVPSKNIPSQSLASTSGQSSKETGRNDLEDGTRYNLFKQNPDDFEIKVEDEDEENAGEELGLKLQTLFSLHNQLRKKFNGKDDAYKKFAIKLLCSNPRMYKSLQPWLKLPGTIELSGLKIMILPKLNDSSLEWLSMKIKSLPAKAKYCSICVDEVELKPNLYYDVKADQVYGFEIKGDAIVSANYAYVIVLQSFYFDWKQPITYTFCPTAKTPAELDSFITETVTKLFSMNISIIGLVTNEKKTFQQYAAAKKVTIGRPYFFIDGRIIYYIIDVPSLLKCLHIDLMKTKFYDSQTKQIWWEFIKYIYLDQQLRNIRLTPKLTLAHIQPDSKNITVEQSAQIFSNSVSAALEAYIALGAISAEAKATATFIKTINDLFDALNTDEVEAKGLTIEVQSKILAEAHIMFSRMKTYEDDSKDTKTCQLFLITIQSMQHLFDELKVEKLSQFYTRRLNQDCIVDFLQSAQKNEAKLTPIQFIRAFSKCFQKSMLKNNPCRKLDTDETFQMAEHIMKKEIANPSPHDHPSLVSLQGETDYRMELPIKSSLIYVSSYLVYKCSEKHECPTFQKALKAMRNLYEENSMFDSYKRYNKQASFYGKLRLPPEEFIQYIFKLEDVLYNNFFNHFDGKIGSELFERLLSIPKYEICSCFPSEYMIKLFIRLRMYTILHYSNGSLKLGISLTSICINLKKLTT